MPGEIRMYLKSIRCGHDETSLLPKIEAAGFDFPDFIEEIPGGIVKANKFKKVKMDEHIP
jgi:hypothetical protein